MIGNKQELARSQAQLMTIVTNVELCFQEIWQNDKEIYQKN
jgi:hypothetical protein